MSERSEGWRRQMISIELVRAVQAERERQMGARQRQRITENGGRRIRINRRGRGC